MNEQANVVIPDEYLIEIGKVTVQWSVLETVFDLCSIKLAGMDVMEPRGTAIFAHMTFPLKLDVFVAMVDSLQSGYPRLQNYKAVVAAVREAQTIRNKIVHSKWLFRDGIVYLSRITARGAVKTSTDPITVDELRKAAIQIESAARDLLKLVIISEDQ